MADKSNPEVNINVKANVEDAKKPLDALVSLMNKQREAVAGTQKTLAEAAKSQSEVQRVARELMNAVEMLGDDALKQRVSDLFLGGIENAARMESRVKHLTRETQVLERSTEGVLSRLNSMEMPGGGDLETQVKKATAGLGFFEKRYGEMAKAAQEVEQNMKSLGNASELNNVVQTLATLKARLEEVGMNSASGAEHSESMARALRAEAEALQEGLPGVEQKRSALMREAEAYERIAAAQKTLAAGSNTRLERVAELVRDLGDGQTEAVAAGLKRMGNEVTAMEGRVKAADSAVQAQEQQKRVEFEKAAEREKAEHEKELKRQNELRVKMELAGMSKRELTAETLRLTNAMREAARVGNNELYEQLRQRMMAARSAQETLTRELQLNRIAGMQQVQTARSMAQSLSAAAGAMMNLSENAKTGQLDLMGVAESIIGLRSALQAGLGPMGAALLALQGLQAVWNYFAQERNAAAEKMRELAEAAVEADRGLRAAQEAMSSERGEKRRIEAAEALTGHLQTQLDLLKETERQIGLNTEAELHRIAMAAQGDAQEVALKRLQLQAAYNRGEIDKFALDEAILHVNADAAYREKQRQLDARNVQVMAAQEQADVRRDEYDAARWAERLSMEGFSLTQKQAEGMVAAWKKAQADFEEMGGDAKEATLAQDRLESQKHLERADGLMKEALEMRIDSLDEQLKEFTKARQAIEAAYAAIPEFARDNGTQAYGQEVARRESFNKGLDDEEAKRKEAWEQQKRQAEAEAGALKRQEELFNQWHEGESVLLNQRLSDIGEARKRDEEKREHERAMARLREDVRKLGEAELQAELARLRGLASAEKNGRVQGYRKAEAGVVLAEVGRREQTRERLRERMMGNEQAGSKREAGVMRAGVELATKVLERQQTFTAQDVAKLERLVSLAQTTQGDADNAVLRRVLSYMEQNAKAHAKALADRAALQQRVASLERQLQASLRAVAR